jgi:hypothetical protein
VRTLRRRAQSRGSVPLKATRILHAATALLAPLRPVQATAPGGSLPANWTTACAACGGPCGSAAPRPRPGPPVGNEAVPAAERLGPRDRVGHPQRHRLLRIDDRLQQRRPSTCAEVGGMHIEHMQLPRPRRSGIQGGPDMAIPISSLSRPATAKRFSRPDFGHFPGLILVSGR